MKNQNEVKRPAPPKWIVELVFLMLSRQHKRKKTFAAAFDLMKAAGELCLLVIAFLGTPLRAMAAIVTVGFGVLRARDVRIHPAEGTPAEAATDALALAASLVMSQVYFAVQSPTFATEHLSDLLHGIGLATPLIFTWRLFFHLCTAKTDPRNRPAYCVFRTMFRVTAMWIVTVWFLQVSNAQAVPGGHLRDFVLLAGPLIAAGISRRLITGERLALWETPGTFTLFTDPEVQEIQARSVLLPGSEHETSRPAGAVFFQVVTVVSLMTPIGIALWRFGFGDPSNIKWAELTGNAIALALIVPALKLLRHFNGLAGEILRQSIQTKTDDPGGWQTCADSGD
jgi:hypothetical protein